jgi:aspartyl-tRNA(Asn)/glutamyl-tRNA(Gln) amidotransferase subunit C
MPEVHQIDIHHVAKLARLKLTDEEASRYETQLNGILSYIDTLTRYDLGGVEPTAHAIPVFDVLRADEARPGFTQEQALANAPKRHADQIQIPKVIE